MNREIGELIANVVFDAAKGELGDPPTTRTEMLKVIAKFETQPRALVLISDMAIWLKRALEL